MKSHPAADLFPMMTDAELAELTADIKANGLLNPIVLLNGQILDGRNRLRACEIAGVEHRFWYGPITRECPYRLDHARRKGNQFEESRTDKEAMPSARI